MWRSDWSREPGLPGIHTCDTLEVYRQSVFNVFAIVFLEKQLHAVLTCHLGGGVRVWRLVLTSKENDRADCAKVLSLLNPICLLSISESTRMFAGEALEVGWLWRGLCRLARTSPSRRRVTFGPQRCIVFTCRLTKNQGSQRCVIQSVGTATQR